MTTFLNIAQQQPTGADAAAFAAIFVMLGFFLLIMFGISLLICFLLYSCQSRIPREYRTLEPGLIFLLLIPLFQLIWNFFVYQRIAESYKNFFDAHGRTDVGDCGKGIGLWLAICTVLSVIPCVGYVTGLAALVLLILFIVKAFELKGKVQSILDQPHPSSPPPSVPPTST
ncbi:MAG: hypothetical protein O7G85_08840 [Planctomycetota bacterium]|nr:hypothetical protein [Planctomycetota bacterium]